jgi:hypothetical protein
MTLHLVAPVPPEDDPPPRLAHGTRVLLDAREPLVLAVLDLAAALVAVAYAPTRDVADGVEVGFRQVDDTLAALRRAWMRAPLVFR